MENVIHTREMATTSDTNTRNRSWMVLFSSFILFFAFNGLSQDAVSNEANPALMKTQNKEHEVILLAKTIWNKHVELKEKEASYEAKSLDFQLIIQPFMEKFKQGCPSYPAPSFMIMDSEVLLSWVREHREEAILLDELMGQILVNN